MASDARRRPYLALLTCAVTAVLVLAVWKVMTFLLKFRHITGRTETGEPQETPKGWTFRGFIYYQIAHWFVWTESAAARVIIGIFIGFVLVGAISYCVMMDVQAGAALWKIFVWLVAPDAGAAEDTHRGAFVGAVVSCGGLLIFALVLTFLQETFTSFLEGLKLGRAPVMERRHVVILGFSQETLTLLQDICTALRHEGGTMIAILTEQGKPEVEAEIQGAGLDFCGSKVVVRSGTVHCVAALQHVAVDTCSTLIITPRHDLDKELADATMMRMMLLLRGQGWPKHGKTVAVCSLAQNVAQLKRLGGPSTTVIMPHCVIAKLMVQCGQGCGLGMAVQSVLGGRGSRFFIRQAPRHLEGLTFGEASLHFPSAVLIGILPAPERPPERPRSRTPTPRGFLCGPPEPADGPADTQQGEPAAPVPVLCPDRERRLQPGDELVFLASLPEDAKPAKKPLCTSDLFAGEAEPRGDEPCASPSEEELPMTGCLSIQARPQHILILGWNDCIIGPMLLELDVVVATGSEVLILAQTPAEEREDHLRELLLHCDEELVNVRVTHVVGNPANMRELAELDPPVEKATRIFALSDQGTEGEPPAHDKADARTLLTILNTRHLMCSRDRQSVPIVPQVVDSKTPDLCRYADLPDYVNSTELEAALLALVAEEPRVRQVMEDVTSLAGELKFMLRSLQDYLRPGERLPRRVSFVDAAAAAGALGDVLVGWTRRADGRCEVVVNPAAKDEEREWSAEKDMLMVLVCRRSSQTGMESLSTRRGASFG